MIKTGFNDELTRRLKQIEQSKVMDDLYEKTDWATEVFQKAIPRKPSKLYPEGYICPCEHEVDYYDNYCYNCGQRLDWSDY